MSANILLDVVNCRRTLCVEHDICFTALGQTHWKVLRSSQALFPAAEYPHLSTIPLYVRHNRSKQGSGLMPGHVAPDVMGMVQASVPKSTTRKRKWPLPDDSDGGDGGGTEHSLYEHLLRLTDAGATDPYSSSSGDSDCESDAADDAYGSTSAVGGSSIATGRYAAAGS